MGPLPQTGGTEAMIGASCEYCEESYETADGLIADSRGYFCDDFCRGAFTEVEESDKLRDELAQAREQLAAAERERDAERELAAWFEKERNGWVEASCANARERDSLRAEVAMLRRDSARPHYSESELVQKLTAERDNERERADGFQNGYHEVVRERNKWHLAHVRLERQLAEMTSERDELAKLVGQALCAFTLDEGEAFTQPKDHALIGGVLKQNERIFELQRQLAEIREAWGELPANPAVTVSELSDIPWIREPLERLDRAIRGSEPTPGSSPACTHELDGEAPR